MALRLKAQNCPACKHSFTPWRCWQITRWSCIQCPNCDVQLNRRTDIQSLIVTFFLIVPLLSGMYPAAYLINALGGHWLFSLALIVFLCALVWLVDLLTIRLVVAKNFRWLKGYEI